MGYLSMDANVSEDALYRYWLSRQIGPGTRTLGLIGVNPSIADARRDDQTIRKGVGFAARLKCDWLYMLNICAFRATDVRELKSARDPMGPSNRDCVLTILRRCDIVIAAWGRTLKLPNDAARAFASELLALPNVMVLGFNDDGSPKHPLFVPYDTALVPARKDLR